MIGFRAFFLTASVLFVLIVTGCSSIRPEADITVGGVFGPVSLAEFDNTQEPLVGFWYGYWISISEGSKISEVTEATFRLREPDGEVLGLPTTTVYLKSGEDQGFLVAGYGADVPGKFQYSTGQYQFEVEVAGRTYTSSLQVDNMIPKMILPVVEVREATTNAFRLSWNAVPGAALYRASANCKDGIGESRGESSVYVTDTSVTYDATALGLTAGVTCFYEVIAFDEDFRGDVTPGGTNVSVEAAVYRNAFEGVVITNP